MYNISGELFNYFYSYFRILEISLSSIDISVDCRRRFFLLVCIKKTMRRGGWIAASVSYLFSLIKGVTCHSSGNSLCQ